MLSVGCYLLLATCYLLIVTCHLLLATCYLSLSDTCNLILSMILANLKLAISCKKTVSFRSCSATRSYFILIMFMLLNSSDIKMIPHYCLYGSTGVPAIPGTISLSGKNVILRFVAKLKMKILIL